MIKTHWTGDKGDTRLFGGEATTKDSARVDAYGDIDELNSCVGLVRARLEDKELDAILHDVQKDLFAIGAELAKAKGDKGKISKERIAWIENAVKKTDGQIPNLTKFIIPSGTPAAALLHVARAIARRAERKCVSLKKTELVNEDVIKYLNRLSSLLFSLARLVNKKSGVREEEW